MSTFRCVHCGIGTVRPTKGPGRTQPWLNIPDLPVPADLVRPTCDHCGEVWEDADDFARSRQALSDAYSDAVKTKAADALARLRSKTVAPTDVERVIGLSGSYLARLEHGKEPSAVIVSLLALLAKDPSRLDELRDFWRMARPSKARPVSGARSRRVRTSAKIRRTR